MEGEHDPEPPAAGDGAGADGASVGAVTPPPASLPEPEPAASAPPPPPSAPPPYMPPEYVATGAPPPPPSSPPPYAPPVYGSAPPAPPTAPPDYAPFSPPPASAPMPLPSGFAPPPAARKGGRRGLAIGAIVAVVLIALLGGVGALANASLSATYSPKAALTDYFAAQARGDVNGMWSNGTFETGGGSQDFFSKDALAAMMANDQNRAVSDVSITSTQNLDSSTSKLGVAMTWAGTQITQTYTVSRDTSRVHDLFYYSWRVEIPAQAITMTLPNQPGAVTVDGISVSSPSTVQVIQGYHSVQMAATDIYDAATQVVNASAASAAVTFPSTVSQGAFKAAADSVKGAFANETCDTTKYFDCPNHKYTVPSGFYDTLPAAGGDIRANSSWIIVFTGDPTTNMKLVVTTDAGKVTASGTCAMALTVDGNKTYNFTGDWTATLTYTAGGVASDVLENCDAARA